MTGRVGQVLARMRELPMKTLDANRTADAGKDGLSGLDIRKNNGNENHAVLVEHPPVDWLQYDALLAELTSITADFADPNRRPLSDEDLRRETLYTESR
jgi:hypothetical protein